MTETIPIKSYSWSEVACMYNADISLSAACKILHRWIRRNAGLEADLHMVGWRKGLKRLTPHQVEIIFSYLGYP